MYMGFIFAWRLYSRKGKTVKNTKITVYDMVYIDSEEIDKITNCKYHYTIPLSCKPFWLKSELIELYMCYQEFRSSMKKL